MVSLNSCDKRILGICEYRGAGGKQKKKKTNSVLKHGQTNRHFNFKKGEADVISGSVVKASILYPKYYQNQ